MTIVLIDFCFQKDHQLVRSASLPVRFTSFKFGQIAVLFRFNWTPELAFAVFAFLILDLVIGDVHAAI